MSLLNQVLRDLDRRQAAAAPSAKVTLPRALAPNGRQRAMRWGLGIALTLAAVVAGGWAQGSLKWPPGAPVPQAVAAAPVAQAVAAAPVAQAVVATTPVPAAATAPAAVLAPPVATPAPVDPSPPAPSPREPVAVQVAIAAPSVRSKRQPLPSTTHSPNAPTEAQAPVAAAKAEARIELRATARSPQERAEAQYQRGVNAHQAGQINESAVAFTTALREDPRHVGARVAQAGLLIGQGRTDEALTLLKDGLALAPTQAQLALMLARLQAERQDWTSAADTLKAAGAHANDAEFQGFYAAILQRAGRHGDAVERYGLALRLAPNRGVWWMGLAISLEETGQAYAARAAFQRAKAIGLPEGASGYVDARLKQLG